MKFTPEDETFLRRTFALAEKGRQTVSPNPVVGAVIVKDNTVIAEGWHRRAGSAHAEIIALEQAGEQARGATLYVNLEPCCHWGRTPPCCEAIVSAGIVRVVAATTDANPKVNGEGFRKLAEAGIELSYGFLADEAEEFNEVYFHFIRTGRPFVHVKAGLSLDGRIASATGKSQWITSEDARRYAHRLRQRYDGILVGVGTILADDPRLDVRIEGGGTIHRIVLDSSLRLPADARLFDADAGRDIIIATTHEADTKKADALTSRGAKIIRCDERDGKVDLSDLLMRLGSDMITGLMVEGGGETIASFVRHGLANKFTFVYAPMIIGGKGAVPVVGGPDIDELRDAYRLRDLRCFPLGPDIAIEGYPAA